MKSSLNGHIDFRAKKEGYNKRKSINLLLETQVFKNLTFKFFLYIIYLNFNNL